MLQCWFTAGCSTIGQESDLATTKLLPGLLVARFLFETILKVLAKTTFVGFEQGHRALQKISGLCSGVTHTPRHRHVSVRSSANKTTYFPFSVLFVADQAYMALLTPVAGQAGMLVTPSPLFVLMVAWPDNV
jgi:hypothetical protein